ncbi:hypothetical protein [Alteromonas halophila]|uniref:hypothetical protein n=1 Tax=Alteromonas halophila TaxID=516698 RepID=UPI001674E168|nr:hypothetical protein [Alteromonas halophila]
MKHRELIELSDVMATPAWGRGCEIVHAAGSLLPFIRQKAATEVRALAACQLAPHAPRCACADS